MAKTNKTTEGAKTSITFEMPTEILEAVNKISSKTGLSKVNLFCRALVQYYNIETETPSFKEKINETFLNNVRTT